MRENLALSRSVARQNFFFSFSFAHVSFFFFSGFSMGLVVNLCLVVVFGFRGCGVVFLGVGGPNLGEGF